MEEVLELMREYYGLVPYERSDFAYFTDKW